MKKIISAIIFMGFGFGIFAIMDKIQTNSDFGIKDLEKILQKKVETVKEFKKNYIDNE